MSRTKGVVDPSQKDRDDFFVGYLDTPKVDRRFLLGALPVALAGGAGASWAIAKELGDPGAGSWQTGKTHEITGALVANPYPMIRMPAPGTPYGMRTALLVAIGKCTSSLKLKKEPSAVTASGVLIQRKDRQMLEVPPFAEDWLSPAEIDLPSALVSPEIQSLGQATLRGKILDSKCFFGVMRPSHGKTHKACASLCIRGGIPPSFRARDRQGRELILLVTDENGAPVTEEIIPFVADPVEATGEIIRVGDLLHYRIKMISLRHI